MTQQRLKFADKWEMSDLFSPEISPTYVSEWGALFDGDCLDILPRMSAGIADMVFADPPFNLGKIYGNRVNDNLPESEYVEWCKTWIDECVRILKPGGAFFIYNLPKWNILLAAHLMSRNLKFRHWIAVNIKACLPIAGRLYPSHYSLIYFTKGKAKTFRRIRTPIETCRHCGGELRDYGGHRDAMNPLGVNLTDVWNDIPPVRHSKFKSKRRKANQLSTRILYRAIHMSTVAGELVLDPFGGSGTTFDVCEREGRHWLGIELEDCDVIIDRLESGDTNGHAIIDYVED